MRIVVSSIFVDDQDKALQFYTKHLGFVKKHEIPLGEHRWLTVVGPDDPDGPELLLEPDTHPAVGPFKRALVEDGIPFTSFAVEDVSLAPNTRGCKLPACNLRNRPWPWVW
jgi:catechol 2,3-dioxygenase-like lactoylglutathione lyase family enzyme